MANYIYIGDISNPSFSFDDDSIMSVTMDLANNIVGQELSIDTIEAEVVYDDVDGTLQNLAYATPVTYVRSGNHSIEFFCENIKRVGKTRYVIQAVSFVGIMDNQMYYGGLYRRRNLVDLIEAIVASNGLARYKQLEYIRTGPAEAGSTEIKGVKVTSGSASLFANHMIHAKFRLAGITEYSTTEHAIIGSPFGEGGTTTYGYGLALRGNGTTASGAYKFLLRLRYCRTDYTVYSDLVIGDTVTIDLYFVSGSRNRYCDWTVEHEDGTTESGTFYIAFADFIPGIMKTYGGGLTSTNEFDGHPYVLDIYTYYITDTPGTTTVLNAVPLIDMNTGNIIIRDTITGYTIQLPGASYIPGTMVSRTGNFEDTIEINAAAANILRKLEFDDAVKNLVMTGWLDIGTKRNALYQVMFASCVNMLHKNNDGILFTFLDSFTQTEIETENIYQEGNVEQPAKIRKISLTEHSIDYVENDIVVFDNTGDATRTGTFIALFNRAPISGTPTASGLTIHSWCSNAAIVSGIGTITADVYHCDRKVIEQVIEDLPQGSDVSVSNAQLVTFINSDSVLERVLAYYSHAHKVRVSFLYNDELPGRQYSFMDLFDEARIGFLERMTLSLSAKIKAASEFVCGYTPPEFSNAYTESAVLTGSGTWTVPASVFEKSNPKIRVVLIGGGTGGYSGAAGQNAVEGVNTDWNTKTPAKGGAYGKSGEAGKIYDFVIEDPPASLAYACGVGGAGGTCQEDGKSGAGTAGTDTTIVNGQTTYSSAAGLSRERGIVDIFHNITYGYVPQVWDDEHGKGGDGGYVVIDSSAQYGYRFVLGESVTNPFTGTTNTGGHQGEYGHNINPRWLSPGAGGGAAMGTNGSNGYISSYRTYGSDWYYSVGNGANGADASYVPAASFYGCGGVGGAGGGGAGSAGFFTPEFGDGAVVGITLHKESLSESAKGGRGGAGGTGGAGCIIIYY